MVIREDDRNADWLIETQRINEQTIPGYISDLHLSRGLTEPERSDQIPPASPAIAKKTITVRLP